MSELPQLVNDLTTVESCQFCGIDILEGESARHSFGNVRFPLGYYHRHCSRYMTRATRNGEDLQPFRELGQKVTIIQRGAPK